jgi:hypothetical protein
MLGIAGGNPVDGAPGGIAIAGGPLDGGPIGGGAVGDGGLGAIDGGPIDGGPTGGGLVLPERTRGSVGGGAAPAAPELPAGAAAPATGGGLVLPDRVRGGVDGVAGGRGGSCTPLAGALRARRGGSGGSRRPHDWHTARSSAFSALQNGQNRMCYRPDGSR